MSVQKRVGKTGIRWVAVVDDPRGPLTGKRQQRKKTFATKREAEQWARQTRNAIDHGEYLQPTTDTTGTYLRHWLTTVEPAIRPSSYRRFREIIMGRVAGRRRQLHQRRAELPAYRFSHPRAASWPGPHRLR